MSFLRVRYLLAGLAVAAAFLLGAVCDWGQLSAFVAARGPSDALLGVIGLVLAAMTGAAGVLIAGDVRAETAAAQAWHEIHTEAVVFATPAETTPMGVGDVHYATRAQDDSLRRILLAHRFMVPVTPSSVIELLAPEHGDARAAIQPAGASIKPELHAVRKIPAADGLGERLTAPAAAQRKFGPPLITTDAMSAGLRKGHYTVRMASAPKRVANAGNRWDGPVFTTAAPSPVTGSGSGCNEIVLADRNGRGESSAPSDVAPEPQAKVQPCCRGPPRATFRRHVAGGPAHPGKPFRETDRLRTKPTAELVVLDNLGDPVPICEAELAVLETYLDDVLRDVLGSADTATKPT